MPDKNEDLHGFVPEHSSVVLLLIDLINDLEFPGGEKLEPHALAAAKAITILKKRCAEAGIPTIYVNDNFGRWQSNFRKIVDHCRDEPVRGREIVRMLEPDEERDYFVLKPKHSGFFSTTLDILLDYIQAKTLILTGVAGDICVLFTANDAYMRDFHLIIPRDCIASLETRNNDHALEQMRTVLKADIRPSTELDLARIAADGPKHRQPPAPQPQAKGFASE